ncbi:hypothetical protein [Ekhidna sp.]|uniref:hypothetical protein n=1 Tax=Ekhidna sp. TaxID=2608089 RepID=UPI0032EFB77E
MNKLEFDSKGQPFIIDCTIYLFQGDKVRDFFSLWVKDGKVVKAPPRRQNFLTDPIEQVIKTLKKQGYECIDPTSSEE